MSLMFNGGDRARQYQQRNSKFAHKQPTPTNKELARLERINEQRHSRPAEPLFSQLTFSIFSKRKAPDPQKSVTQSDPVINPTTQRLVIHDYKDRIVKAVKNSPITIIVAPTGCGKSTYVPQFLAAEGHKVVVLQPRRLPSSKLAEYGAMLDGSELGEKVGFRHSLARLFSRKTEIIYATEGYELTKALATGDIDPKITYIFDKFHEKKTEAILFLALIQKRRAEGLPVPKVVIMSATMEHEALLNYLGDKTALIEIESRRYPIEQRKCTGDMTHEALIATANAENCIGFVPGKNAIADQIHRLKSTGSDVIALPLHSELSHQEQQRVFQKHDKPMVIFSTSIAQTSLTIDHLDTVLISGTVRRSRMHGRVKALTLENDSQDGVTQKEGRVGRVGPGVSVYLGKTPRHRLAKSDPVDIENSPIEQHVLKVIGSGMSFESLNRHSLYPLSQEKINAAYSVLRDLGLLSSKGNLMGNAREVLKIPVDPHMGIVIVEAMKLEKENPGLLDLAIDCAAIFEVEGVIKRDSRAWDAIARGDSRSDLLGQLSVFRAAAKIDLEELQYYGVKKDKFLEAVQKRNTIRARLGIEQAPISETGYTEREKILLRECIAQGLKDCIFRKVGKGQYKAITYADSVRTLGQDHLIDAHPIICGKPINIESMDSFGNIKTSRIILMATAVTRDFLRLELGDHLKAKVKKELKKGTDPSEPSRRRKKADSHRRPAPQRNSKRSGKNWS